MGEVQSVPAPEPRRPRPSEKRPRPWQSAGISEATIFDYYEIGGLLGSGSFGQVRQCWPVNEENGRRYAVKVVDSRGEVFKQAAAHLSARQEANILKVVQHPHIVNLVDVFEQERWVFLVMEYVCGGELFGALADPRTMVIESCIATVGRQLLQALQYLHDRYIVHRDVKAENILLLSNPVVSGNWHIKLIDFGLAMRVEQPNCFFRMSCREQAPLEELICGTAYYCAPEVWVNDYGPKVDVWAAGVVLYLALFGTFPFYSSDPNTLEAMICCSEVVPSYEPAKTADSVGYQASREARGCIQTLLTKEHQSRPRAEHVLEHQWFRAGNFSPGASFGQQRTISMTSDCYLLSAGDQPIPPAVRAKAGRAAARPPVDGAKEQARTNALESLKARAKNEYPIMIRKSSKSSSTGSTSDADGSSMRFSSPDNYDMPPADTSMTDSDVEDHGHMCMCGRSSYHGHW